MFPLIDQNLLCSNSYSYQKNYQFQSALYNKLAGKTKEIQWIRLSVFFIHNISASVTIIARTSGIAETFFKGGGMFLLSPFASTPQDQAKKGLEELIIHTSKNIMRLAYFPVEYLGDSLGLLLFPKMFIFSKQEQARVDLKHAIANTLGSVEHIEDIIDSDGIAYNNSRAN